MKKRIVTQKTAGGFFKIFTENFKKSGRKEKTKILQQKKREYVTKVYLKMLNRTKE